MTYPTWLAPLLLTTSCGYWAASPSGDVAPHTWQTAPEQAGATQLGTTTPASPSGQATTIAERLGNLAKLRETGVISDVEYRARRARILDGL